MAEDERRDERGDERQDDEIRRVEEQIAEARTAAEDAGILEDGDEPRFEESGTIRPEEDDQQIAPPG
jgi:hypothetical protein